MNGNIMLIGFMGAGKTTVSKELSKITGKAELDMDAYIVEKEGSWMKLFTSIGLFSTYGEEVNLYRIYDISVMQTLTNKIWGTGTVVLHCNLNNVEKLYLTRVKDPYKVRAMLAELIEVERAKRVTE